MNDFTKAELEILHSSIEYWIENIALPGSKVSPVIIKKLQSMIDNYCEHESILDYISNKVIEKHKTCLTDLFDNGYFWAMKELQEFILKKK